MFHGETDWLEGVRTLAIEFQEGSRAKSAFDRIMVRHGFSVRESGGHTVIATREGS
jgi:hypothetical protein